MALQRSQPSLLATAGFALLLVSTAVGYAADPPSYSEPSAAGTSVELMQVADGFRVELVAAEPLVADPVSICWAGDGSLWVVEMGGYPLEKNKGRIKRLVDTDGDGRFDHATVLVDQLSHPTSVLPWRDGLLVADAPNILFVRDTDSDGRADSQRVVFTGFGVSNAQHQVNSLRWGLDGFVHAANGDSGGVIVRGEATNADRPGVDIHGHDFRFQVETGDVQLQSGMSQHTRFRDDFGQWFGGNSAWPLWHDRVPVRYLNRNAQAATLESCAYVMDPAANPLVFPISSEQPRLNEFQQRRRMTSACGGSYYRDDRFGPSYLNSVFVCDPANNLVHHAKLKRQGVSFTADRPKSQVKQEFLASKDAWFRPVQAATGPDGALYIVDMYRLIIEHPEYFERNPVSLKASPRGGATIDDPLRQLLRRGARRGRIYRIVHEKEDLRPALRLEQDAKAGELIQELQSRNGVRRDIAHRRLVQKRRLRDGAIVDRVAELTHHATPQVRVQAFATLGGLDALDSKRVLVGMRDQDPRVRRFAVQLAESRLTDDQLYAELLARVRDADASVRLQAALALGGSVRPDAGRVLGEFALRHIENEVMIAAVLSADHDHTQVILRRAIQVSRDDQATEELVSGLLQSAVRNGDAAVLAQGLNALAQLAEERRVWRLRVLGRLLKSLDNASMAWADLGAEHAALHAAIQRLKPVFSAARRDALDPTLDPKIRAASVTLLGRDGEILDDARRLNRLLAPNEPLPIQGAAVRSLAAINSPEVAGILLQNLPQRGPETRRDIVLALLERKAWTLSLLEAIEAKTVSSGNLSRTQRERLLVHYYRDVRAAAKRALVETAPPTEQSDVAYARQVLKLKGEAKRGAPLFVKHCGNCHCEPPKRAAGPPLSSLTQLTKPRIIDSVLAPNRAVEPAYASYSVVTRSGRLLSGVIRRESATAIEIVDAEGKKTSLLRADIEQLQASEKSLMPEQLKRVLANPQDLADIIAALRSANALQWIRQAAKSTQ